jgi:hypothetical protein
VSADDLALVADAAALQQRSDSRLEEVCTLLDSSERAKALSEEALASAGRELQSLRDELADLRVQLDAARAAVSVPSTPPVDQMRMVEAGALWVLKGAARQLDRAQSLGDVLDCLARSARQIVEGTSVHVVAGDCLHEWSLMHGAAGSAPSTRLWPSPDGTAAGTPENAFEVRVGGAVVAVVLVAAAPTDESTSSSSDTLTILTRQAGLVLESMTLRRSAGLLPEPAGMAAASGDVRAGVAR